VQQTQVPNLIDLTEKQARAAIGDAGLKVGRVDYQADQDVAKDKVISQDPNRDQYVDPGSVIDIVVSTGKPLVTVPSVVGQDKDSAEAAMRSAHLKPVLKQQDSDEPRGQVVSTDPSGGESVPQGTTVEIAWSDGPEKVPDVVDLQQDEAEKAIRDAGFEPKVLESSDTTEPAGTVIDQSPSGGETASEGSTVTIVVSNFQEEPSESPSPTETPTETPTLPTETPPARRGDLPPGRVEGP
jgi:serine/threonine-protein kinase